MKGQEYIITYHKDDGSFTVGKRVYKDKETGEHVNYSWTDLLYDGRS